MFNAKLPQTGVRGVKQGGLNYSLTAALCEVFCKWATVKGDMQFKEGNSEYAELIFHCLHIKSPFKLNSSCHDIRRRRNLFKPLAPDCISLFSMTVQTPVFPPIHPLLKYCKVRKMVLYRKGQMHL